MPNGVRNGRVSITWEQEFRKLFSFLNELPLVFTYYLFVYLFLICQKGMFILVLRYGIKM